ncbi:MAG: 4-hydroxy-3-methylbut-2-en-1-yl diphosphate synthase [Candidatus Omnitrophica bacterium CG11_big_fil_rev_8_21_14_0_20_42_13]|uniref:4-hydroxy-3-methylbut-2-en-1-yl diphosphate synthase (flavodoxin) n=1 Tax=Candidatus Ghiorseimicrobium undicola TaxID=1974746 RepID=A0A2H0LZ09_9BACT|nr:MAG: 4-hydroxy-3-methylbut-2-en-1-yl diphosphate synthase [Candidatus Omnitrophica bacterium CG11_big_fil_rev_8_21_14_0_20_42_13]
MNITRRSSKEIKIGNVKIGAGHPIAIQSMAKVDTRNIAAVSSQIKQMQKCGCEVVRVAVKDKDAACAIRRIKSKINIPLVADIHFNYELALFSIENGADKIRLNPGNIYKKDQVSKIAAMANKAGIPIRVGVNSGSMRKYSPNVEGMVKSALSYINMLEDFGFYNIVVSLKASSVSETIEAYRKFAKKSRYPLHLGITATGTTEEGRIKSAIGIGALLADGIGDTIRVSLTADPLEEIEAAKEILKALNLRSFGPEIISCPTCGRCEVDLINMVKKLEGKLSTASSQLSTRPIKLAVMGCEVNGPGEARAADFGIAFGKTSGVLFRDKKIVKRIKKAEAIKEIFKELKNYGKN